MFGVGCSEFEFGFARSVNVEHARLHRSETEAGACGAAPVSAYEQVLARHIHTALRSELEF